MSDNHVTMPVSTPSLDHLTTEELGQLRAKFSAASREARRKAMQIISRYPSLKKPWGRSLGMDKNTTPAERVEIHTALERELLRLPDAYLAHAWANSLVVLDEAVRTELLRRTGSAVPKKKPRPEAEPVAEVRAKPREPEKPEPEDNTLGANDLAAMFAQAGDDDSV